MISVDKAVIARLKKDGETFEIFVDCDKALNYRAGKIKDLNEVLAAKEIFRDASRVDRVSNVALKKAFKTEDVNAVADAIIKKGEIQLTTEHKARLREEKRKQIIDFIHRNAVDPVNGVPHPSQRIEMAMNEVKIRIDEFESFEKQVHDIIQKLQPKLRIKLEIRELEIFVPVHYTNAVLNVLKRKTKVLKDQWQGDGSLKATVEIPAGIQEEIENELNKITKGEVDLKIINKR
jgi:ribosome maturation protein SDO1